MDTAKVFAALFAFSPLVAAFAVAIYMLWNSNQKKDQTIMDTMKAHADDRKESQEKIMQIVTQNSSTNLQLTGAVESLTASNKDVVTRLTVVEQKVERINRPVRTAKAA